MRDEFPTRAAAVLRYAIRPTTSAPARPAVGDLIIGECASTGASTVGVVTALVGPPRLGPGALADGPHYRVTVGALYPTGDVVTRTLRPWALVLVPAGSPVVCAECRGEHESAERFVACQVAHLRAEAERVAVAA